MFLQYTPSVVAALADESCGDFEDMNDIYHEKQEGSMCAQHSLNNLLQGSYFTPVDLADIAQRLDNIESYYMSGERDNNSRVQSENMDDTGMFSVQVIQEALKSFDLQLVSLSSQDESAKAAQGNPLPFNAYICNYREHWITVRRIGNVWYNLDSLLAQPELVSDLHLSLLLHQLSVEGYDIFLVKGVLPRCPAVDGILNLSNESYNPGVIHEDSEESRLQEAIALSLQPLEDNKQEEETSKQELSVQELRERRLKKFAK